MRMSDDTFSRRAQNYNMAIPKEQLTAFQRWELASFDPLPVQVPVELSPAAQISAARVAESELQIARQKAHDEGHAAGHQEGYAAGMQQAQRETAQLQTLMQNLQVALNQKDEQLAQSLLDLSMEMARKMAIEALQIKPEIILKVIGTAISSLPHFNHNAHLVLHPSDAELVRRQMGEQLVHAGWKIFTDEKIEPGGCRVETAHSNIDATNTARWQSIVESIGQDKSWLMT